MNVTEQHTKGMKIQQHSCHFKDIWVPLVSSFIAKLDQELQSD
jgi:hypothetical protein